MGLPALVFAAVCLTIVLNVYDGTFLKPPLLYAGAALLVIASTAMSDPPLSLRAVNLPVGLYIGACMLSLVNAHDLVLGVERILQLTCYALFYVWMQAVAVTDGGMVRAVRVMVGVAVIASLISFVHLVVPASSVSGYFAGQIASTSTFGNKAYFGGFLAAVLPLALGNAWQRWMGGGGKLLPGLAVVALAYALVETGSRSSWIGAAAGCMVFLLCALRTGKSRLLAVAALAVIAGISILASPPGVRERFSQLFQTGPHSTVERRTYFYGGAWRAFAASPFLGQGAGNFTVFLPGFRSPEYWMVQSEDIVPHAHDEFLEILSESGIAGFIGFALIVAAAVASAGRKLRTGGPADRAIWGGIIAAVAACLVDNLFNVSLRTVPVALAFWMLLGLATERRPADAAIAGRSIAAAAIGSLLLVAALVWYVPRLVQRFHAERAVLRGLIARYAGDADNARLEFSQAVLFAPRHMEARFFLGANLTERGAYRDAKPLLEGLLRFRPFYPRARTLLALCAADEGDSSGALRLITEELRLETSPQAYYFGSHLAARLGNPQLQYDYLAQALEQNIRAGATDYLLESLDDLPAACQIAGASEKCTVLMDRVAAAFADRPEIMQRIREIRLGMRTG